MSELSGIQRTLVIAEAGVNHNGSMDLARELIDVAAKAGADYVKFQTFKPEKMTSRSATQADYQSRNLGQQESQLEMLKKLTLQPEQHAPLIEYCKTKKIRFLSTAFESESLKFLVEECGVRLLKIPSGEVTNGPFLLEIATTAQKFMCDIVLSTGMCTLGEVESALAILAFGLTASGIPAGQAGFEAAYFSAEGRKILKERVTVLHCTTEYPAPFSTLNLRSMDTLRDAFGLDVGFSDHSSGIAAPLAAVARGACLIEKHFTLDRSMPGPDHKASLEPQELVDMIAGIRDVEASLGSALKGPTAPELKNRSIARKVLVASTSIRSGDMFTSENITAKRSVRGRSPMAFWSLLGTRATRDYSEDESIE